MRLSIIDTTSTGEIFYKGDNILKLNKKSLTKYRKDESGFIFHDFNLLDNMTIMDKEKYIKLMNIGVTKKEI